MDDFNNLTDEQVLALSVSTPGAFAVLVARYEEPFLRKARHILGPREEVEDIVQETFTKIYLNAKRFEKQEGAKFSSWGYKILINTTFTYYQKLKRGDEMGAKLEDEIWAMMPDRESPTRSRVEIEDLVARSLTKLPEPLAQILSLHFLDDMPQKEIGEKLGISVAAVKTRIHRAKKEFKKMNLKFL